jgi:hypothetical protein
MPRAAWWASTADHLYERGLLMALSGEPPEQARDLLDLAEHASPWHAGVTANRHAEQIRARAIPESMASSRDIVALAESARAAFNARDVDSAIEQLSQASAMAIRTDLREAAPPGAAGTDRNPRWLLPQEDLFRPICRAAMEQTLVPPEDVVERLPGYGPLRLAAARQARGPARGGADRWLTRVLALGAEPPAGGSLLAHQAAKAEALALLERWSDARKAYEALLEERCPPRLEAVCWANLAGIYAQDNDLNRMNLARRNARRLGIDVASLAGGSSPGSTQARPRAGNARPR